MTHPNDTYPHIFPLVAKEMIAFMRDRGDAGRLVTRAMNAHLPQLNTSLPYKLGSGAVTFISQNMNNVVYLRLLSGGDEMRMSVEKAKEPELFDLLFSLREAAMLRDGKPDAGCVGVGATMSPDPEARRSSENLISLFDVFAAVNTPYDQQTR